MSDDLSSIITAAAQRHGQDPQALLREAQIESSMNPAAHNASGASGLFQFVPSTAQHYGLANPYDPAASADAAARLMSDNRGYLTKVLGRDPTGGELYLAHQQGMGGAAKLLSSPDAPAASLVGTKAVLANGGNQDMTARQFADMWTSKFAGAKPSGGGSLGALYSTGAVPPLSGGMTGGSGAPTLPAMPQLNPGAVLAAAAPTDATGLPTMAQRHPTVANGGAAARQRALITGQGGLGALFSA